MTNYKWEYITKCLNPTHLIVFVVNLITIGCSGIDELVADKSPDVFTLQEAFITTWSARQITIPTDPKFTYNYKVDWNNDGTIDESGITGDVTHTFEADGEHTIRITGTFPAIRFGILRSAEAKKIISVDQWGNGEWLSMYDAFAECSNLEVPATDIPDLSKTHIIARMFKNATLANPDVSRWNTGNVKNMIAMFRDAKSANPDVSNWNFSNVSRMDRIFDNSGLSPENYGKALIRFAEHENDPTLTLSRDVELGNLPTSFCGEEAQDAKTLLLDNGWIINDRGFISSCSLLTKVLNDVIDLENHPTRSMRD